MRRKGDPHRTLAFAKTVLWACLLREYRRRGRWRIEMVQGMGNWFSERPGGWWIRVWVLCAGLSVAMGPVCASGPEMSVWSTPEPDLNAFAPAAPARSDQRDWSFDSQWSSGVLQTIPVQLRSVASHTESSNGLLFWQFRSALNLARPSASAQVRTDPATRLGFDPAWLEVSLQLRIGF
ncbi:MAG TPA: hypothetical protein ENK16_01580 [Chromatiales bacterium]|nr:hypothetical protein [Chromatiales bacterium]